MANVSFVQATTAENSGGSSTSHSFTGNGLGSVTATTKGIAIVWVESGSSNDPLTVTWGGSSMTKILGGIATPGRGFSSMWYILNPASGAVTLADTYASADSPVLIWSLYDGVKQVAPEASNSGTNSSTSIQVSVTTITANAWLVGGSTNNFGTASAGTNTTGRFLSVRSIGDSNAGQSPAGSYSLQFTGGGSAWGMGVIAIAPDGIVYSLALNVGTFVLTGIATLFRRVINMVASVGTFTLTGIATAFRIGKGIIIDTGSFILTGIATAFRFTGWTNQGKNNTTWTNEDKSV